MIYLLDFCLDIIFHNLDYFASEIQKVRVPLFVSAITYQAITYNGVVCWSITIFKMLFKKL